MNIDIDKLISTFIKQGEFSAVITLVKQSYVGNDKINYLLLHFMANYEKEHFATSDWSNYRYMIDNLSEYCKRNDILEKLFKIYLRKSDIRDCGKLLIKLRREFTSDEVIQLTVQYGKSAMSGDTDEKQLLRLANVAGCWDDCKKLIEEKRERWANDLY